MGFLFYKFPKWFIATFEIFMIYKPKKLTRISGIYGCISECRSQLKLPFKSHIDNAARLSWYKRCLDLYFRQIYEIFALIIYPYFIIPSY
jgi:hypothetical protein